MTLLAISKDFREVSTLASRLTIYDGEEVGKAAPLWQDHIAEYYSPLDTSLNRRLGSEPQADIGSSPVPDQLGTSCPHDTMRDILHSVQKIFLLRIPSC